MLTQYQGLSEELSHIILITIPYIVTAAPGGITEEFLTGLVNKIAEMQITAPIETSLSAYTGDTAPYPALNVGLVFIS